MNERQTEQTTDQKANERPGDQANELMTDWKTTDPIDRPIGGQKEIMFETKLTSASSFTVFSPNWNSVLFSSHYNMFQKKCR